MDVMLKTLSIFFFLVLIANGGFTEQNVEYLMLPPNFILGAGTASYQIEGAWNVSDKAESTWDRFTHLQGGRIHSNATGDIACNSYYKYKEDVAILNKIGLKSYRFSVSWPRILPHGFADKISQDGVNYYKNLIDELLANGIEPMMTIYHWDHPQSLEDAGGWMNPKMVDWFSDYARVVFQEFGEKVKSFVSVNEPALLCTLGYSAGLGAPGKKFHGIGEYLCIHHVLKAHARAYRIYEKEFKQTQKGNIGFNIMIPGIYPKNKGDTSSVERYFQFNVGWTLHPIYSEKGGYPDIMKRVIAERSKEQGYPRSRLPELEPEWIEYIRGTADFLSVNHYTSHLVEPSSIGEVPSHTNDQGLELSDNPSWKSSSSSGMKIVPHGFGDVLRTLKDKYGNITIYVTENGFFDSGGTNDTERIENFHDYLKEMLIAIHRDGVNVQRYYLWSFLDNFEWGRGYSIRYGITHVDFKDPERRRTLKQSAYWWQRLARTRRLEP